MNDNSYFDVRFRPHASRTAVWEELARYITSDIKANGVVAELGSGYGDFINAIAGNRKIAVDHDPAAGEFLDEGIEFFQKDVTHLDFLESDSVDTVFASNLLEHLERDTIEPLLREIRRVLRTDGRCVFLQPNYRYCYAEYFDDYTHVTPFSHVSLADVMTVAGFSIKKCIPRFLPLSMKSRVPKHPLLVRLYLHLPYRPLAKQMYIVGQPVTSGA